MKKFFSQYLSQNINFLYFAIGLLLFGLIYHFSTIQADGYYYLDVGKRIIGLKSLPDIDTFSFNTGFTYWRIIEWLPDIIFYTLYSLGGERLLLLSIPTIFCFIFYFFWIIRSSEFNPLALFLYSIIVFLFYHSLFVIRAEILACLYYFFFFYFTLYRNSSWKRSLAIALGIQVLWVNTHPSFILPVLFSIIAALGEFVDHIKTKTTDSITMAKRYSYLSGLLVLVSLINPYSWESFEDFFFRITSFAYRGVDITQPLGFESFEQYIIWIYLISVLILAYKKTKELPLRIELILLFQVFMTLVGVRYLILLLITAVLLFAPLFEEFLALIKRKFAQTIESVKNRKKVVGLTSILIAFYLGIAPLHYSNLYSSIDRSILFLQNHESGGNIFNPYEYGTYLIHKLFPKYKVFVDGRSYLYESNLVYLDWTKIAYGDDSLRKSLIDCYPINYIIWPTNEKEPLINYLKNNREWVKVFEDKYFSVFKKNLFTK